MAVRINPFTGQLDEIGVETGGTVTSVTGTTDRITSTGGIIPQIDISANYVGQSSITTLGTITTGVWNGTTISIPKGGTGLTAYAQGDLIYASAANVLTALPKNTTATRYLSNAGAANNPSWSQIGLTNGVIGILPIANGGTNASTFSTTNGIAKFDGTRLVASAATIDASNRYINASQPASSAYVFSTLTDVTGDGTEYQVNYGQVPYNQTANMTLAGVFTCPIAGFYAVNLQVTLAELLVGHTYGTLIIEITSGFGSLNEAKTFNPFAISSSGVATININSILKMQAGGTIIGKIAVAGSTKTVDILGAFGGRSSSFFDVVMLWGY